MGRQIEFVHIEEDILPFLTAVEELGGYIVYGDDIQLPLVHADTILSQMATPISQFHIASTTVLNNQVGVLSGNVVEFTNCNKGNSLSRVYEVGRLFISPTSDSVYDPGVLKLFDSMREYIKHNYFYSKIARMYYSPAFKAHYDRNYYYVAKAGRRISL